MKVFNRFSIMATIVGTLAFAGCTEDVYNPEKETQTGDTENPFGEDFSVPDGFDWSMISAIDLNVEVKDEFSGQYNYLIEIFTGNPLNDTNATPIAAGVASQKGNYSTTITLPKTCERIFIRQTDPKQRKEIYEFATSSTMNCKLYYTGASTRTTRTTDSASSAYAEAEKDGVSKLTNPNYQEADVIPSDAGVAYNNGIGRIEINGRQCLFIKESGVYSYDEWGNTDIYVLNGGKIKTEGDLKIGQNATVTIQTGGNIECGGKLTLHATRIKNFGNITAETMYVNNSSLPVEFFNAGAITLTGAVETKASVVNGSKITFYNPGIITACQLTFGATSYVLNEGSMNIANTLHFGGTTEFHNLGKVLADETNGNITTAGSKACRIINRNKGIIKACDLKNGFAIYNDGIIEVNNCNNAAVDKLYNSCTLIVKNELRFANIILDNGSIAGSYPDDNGSWSPVPVISNNSGAMHFILKNGSMIKANLLKIENSPNAITGEGANPSLLQVRQVQISTGGSTTVSNLVLEMPDNAISYSGDADGIYSGHWITEHVANTGYDESKYTFSTCGGYFKPGNEGEAAKDVVFPIIVENADSYTFAFEDNWPNYGDFDLNDLVLTIDKTKTTLNKDGRVKEFKLYGTVRAVGATKTLGAGIRFTKLTPSGISELKGRTQSVRSGELTFEEEQSSPVILLCSNAHTFMGNEAGDNTFINTVKGSNKNTNDGADFEISMKFNEGSEVAPETFNINNLDLFSITKAEDPKSKRFEVHVAGFAPTDRGNTSLFGQFDDASSTDKGKYYISNANLPWGIVIPGRFAWPIESHKISTVYEEFESWVTNGGAINKDWYKNGNSEVFTQ